jgi:hypothetical protein
MFVGKIPNTACDGHLNNAPTGLAASVDWFSRLQTIDGYIAIDLEARSPVRAVSIKHCL